MKKKESKKLEEKFILDKMKKIKITEMSRNSNNNIAFLLADYAIKKKHSTDNISIIIIFL